MSIVVLLAVLIALFALAGRARAQDLEDGDSETSADAPPPSDLSMANQVLEIPQQCDQDSVAFLCDRSGDTSNEPNEDTSFAAEPDTGSVYDYANQNIINDVSSTGTTNLPAGILVPGYVPLAPAPTVVTGPGTYQQWASGPGTYQQWATGPGTYRQFSPGPGYIPPMPLGYRPYGPGAGFGPRPFNGFAASHFGHR